LGDVLRVFVTPRPFTQAGGTNVLIRSELELFHCLFEGCNDWNNRSDRLRFAPVRITASLCHNLVCVLPSWEVLEVPKEALQSWILSGCHWIHTQTETKGLNHSGRAEPPYLKPFIIRKFVVPHNSRGTEENAKI